MMALLVLALPAALPLSVALAGGESPADPIYGPGYTPATIAEYERQQEQFQRERDRKRDELRSAAARETRQRSREAYRRLSSQESRELLRSNFGDPLAHSGLEPLESQPGIEEVEYLSDSSARIRRSNGRRLLVVSAGPPMRAPTESGARAPVSLDLIEREGHFEPANPVVDARFPKRLPGSMQLGDSGIELDIATSAGAGVVEGQIAGAGAFYANVAPDTDFIAKPVPAGVETYVQIRSPEAPEVERLQFQLPAGARLRATEDGGAEVVKGDQPIALILRPSAVDAQGQEVPVSLAIEGETLELRIAHRNLDLAYPILVDPPVYEDWWYNPWIASNRDFAYWNQNNPWWWKFNLQTGAGSPGSTYGSGFGLFVYAKPEYYDGNYAQWQFRAPGSTSYFRRAYFRSSYFQNDGQPAQMHQGIWHDAGGYWTDYRSYGSPVSDVWTDLWPASPQGGRTIVHSMWVGCCVTRTRWAHAYLGGLWLEIDDPEGAEVQWVGDGLRPSHWMRSEWRSAEINSADPGVGVQNVTLVRNGVGDTQGPGCYGDRHSRCPGWWQRGASYHSDWLPEGIIPMRAEATDATGKGARTWDWSVKVDRSQPTMTLSKPPTAAYGLRDFKDRYLYEPEYGLRVAARDESTAGARAGIKRIDLFLNGTRIDTTGDKACPSNSCPLEANFNFISDRYADGQHTVKVVVTDHADNSREESWTVIIDRRGDIYQATEYDGDPASGGTMLAEEAAQRGTQNARRTEPGQTATRGSVPCPRDPSQRCGEVRYVVRSEDADTGAETAPSFDVERGASEGDTRLDVVASIAEPASQDLGAPTASGAIEQAVQAWQVLPPAHGTRYELYETMEEANVDDSPSRVLTRLWIDAVTRMPLHETTSVGGEVTGEVFYTYRPYRLERSELPTDYFAVEKPANPSSDTSIDYSVHALGDPELAPEPGLDELVAEARTYREHAGLNSEEAFVRATFADPTLEASVYTYGVPLTPDEQAVMARRDRVQDSLGVIDDYVAQNAADTYAGSYIDQKNGGLVYVGFTRDTDRHLAALRAVFPYPDDLRGYTAELTASELEALQARVSADVPQLKAEGIDVVSVGADQEFNIVKVGVPEPTLIDELKLQLRYGFHVRLAQQDKVFVHGESYSPPRVNARIPPLHGGLFIQEVRAGLATCTTGFSVSRGSDRRELIANHCGGGGGTKWRHRQTVLGAIVQRHRSTDVALLQIKDRFATNTVFVGPGRIRGIIRGKTTPGRKGQPVCLLGSRRTRPQCDFVTEPVTQAEACVDAQCSREVTVYGQTKAGYRGLIGDSGGSVIHGRTAWGTHTVGPEEGRGPSFFTRISVSLDRLNARLCVTRRCRG